MNEKLLEKWVALVCPVSLKPNSNNDASAFRWLFNPTAKAVIHTQDDYAGMIEVSEDFARYVQDQPDCECELRFPNEGDEFLSCPECEWLEMDKTCQLPSPKLYRWCKPRKPEPPRYAAGNYSGINYVWDHKGRYAVCHGGQMQDMHRIARAMNAMEKKLIQQG